MKSDGGEPRRPPRDLPVTRPNRFE